MGVPLPSPSCKSSMSAGAFTAFSARCSCSSLDIVEIYLCCLGKFMESPFSLEPRNKQPRPRPNHSMQGCCRPFWRRKSASSRPPSILRLQLETACSSEASCPCFRACFSFFQACELSKLRKAERKKGGVLVEADRSWREFAGLGI